MEILKPRRKKKDIFSEHSKVSTLEDKRNMVQDGLRGGFGENRKVSTWKEVTDADSTIRTKMNGCKLLTKMNSEQLNWSLSVIYVVIASLKEIHTVL